MYQLAIIFDESELALTTRRTFSGPPPAIAVAGKERRASKHARNLALNSIFIRLLCWNKKLPFKFLTLSLNNPIARNASLAMAMKLLAPSRLHLSLTAAFAALDHLNTTAQTTKKIFGDLLYWRFCIKGFVLAVNA